jgi:hypothetical protein
MVVYVCVLFLTINMDNQQSQHGNKILLHIICNTPFVTHACCLPLLQGLEVWWWCCKVSWMMPPRQQLCSPSPLLNVKVALLACA